MQAKLTEEQEGLALARLHADFEKFWEEVRTGAFWTLRDLPVGGVFNAYAAGYFDGGKATRELPQQLLKAPAPTKAPGDGGLQETECPTCHALGGNHIYAHPEIEHKDG